MDVFMVVRLLVSVVTVVVVFVVVVVVITVVDLRVPSSASRMNSQLNILIHL